MSEEPPPKKPAKPAAPRRARRRVSDDAENTRRAEAHRAAIAEWELQMAAHRMQMAERKRRQDRTNRPTDDGARAVKRRQRLAMARAGRPRKRVKCHACGGSKAAPGYPCRAPCDGGQADAQVKDESVPAMPAGSCVKKEEEVPAMPADARVKKEQVSAMPLDAKVKVEASETVPVTGVKREREPAR